MNLDRMDEFFALGLGLHGSKHPNKKPGRQLLRFRAGCFYAISKDDQVLRLHSCRALSP
jgi:hypothetical protein